ncbi:hypothetical protein CMUS01_16265 [Colletotrichum musicola]|uniref:Uncharacterized protein n=1 Tax=Colletotrichum musicola TaxID=2175873 RepID=A0A8H6IQE6_9PEZI|nr:hypothetical protein CMUS01_16265 [Colletotrichum musicola]
MDSSISAKNVQLLSNPTKVWKDMGWVNKHMRMDSKAVVRHSNHRCRQDTDLRVPTALIYNLLRRPVDLDHLFKNHKNGSQLGLKAEQSLLRPCDSSSSGTNDGDSLLSSDSSSEFDTALVDSRKHVRTLDEEKKAVVNRLMQAFLRDLDTHLSEPSDTPHDGNSSATSSACRGLGSSATSSTTSSFSNKKRSRQDRSDYRRGDEDGREEKPSKKQEVFSSNADVGEHARAQPPCEVRLPIPMEEFGQEQEDRIRARLSRKPGERRTERERWSDDFQILFDVRDDDVPTPWHDYDLAILSQKETFNEYLRREIIPIMRREIEQQVESYMSDVEPQILSRFRGIIRNLRPPLWESYQRKISYWLLPRPLWDEILRLDCWLLPAMFASPVSYVICLNRHASARGPWDKVYVSLYVSLYLVS